MKKITLRDGESIFEAMVVEAPEPGRVVLFAVGSGGDPERHLPLMNALAEQGCTTVAPCFDRLVSPVPSAETLILRARRLQIALDAVAGVKDTVVGVGHSIGATLLLGLGGGKIWLGPGLCLPVTRESRVQRLVLFSPATGFFQAPGALDQVEIPIQVWAGTLDHITPPDQVEFLKNSLQSRVTMDVRVIEGAGHFSFLNILPPRVADPISDRTAFLEYLASSVCGFVTV
jgi:pimeloyl-ACP methyl ester carboxylesterase